jgi:hypothetical protein
MGLPPGHPYHPLYTRCWSTKLELKKHDSRRRKGWLPHLKIRIIIEEEEENERWKVERKQLLKVS